jgi:hypothetical protein
MAEENELLETIISTDTETSQGQSSEPNWCCMVGYWVGFFPLRKIIPYNCIILIPIFYFWEESYYVYA